MKKTGRIEKAGFDATTEKGRNMDPDPLDLRAGKSLTPYELDIGNPAVNLDPQVQEIQNPKKVLGTDIKRILPITQKMWQLIWKSK